MIGPPLCFLLQQFGEHVYRAFGHVPYHVGSSLLEKSGWRDVDVRLILSDEDYAAAGYGDPAHPQDNEKWVSTVLAWATFGRTLTGLPIDFQIQQQTHANETEKGRRSALFDYRLVKKQQDRSEWAVEQFKKRMTCPTCGTAAFQPNERCADHRENDGTVPSLPEGDQS